jgi:hypothetical protein
MKSAHSGSWKPFPAAELSPDPNLTLSGQNGARGQVLSWRGDDCGQVQSCVWPVWCSHSTTAALMWLCFSGAVAPIADHGRRRRLPGARGAVASFPRLAVEQRVTLAIRSGERVEVPSTQIAAPEASTACW